MDIEQLKLVLDTVNAAGDGATTLAMIYMGKEFLIEAAITAVFGASVVCVYRLIRNAQTCEQHIAEIASVAGFTTPLSRRELEFIKTRLKETAAR